MAHHIVTRFNRSSYVMLSCTCGHTHEVREPKATRDAVIARVVALHGGKLAAPKRAPRTADAAELRACLAWAMQMLGSVPPATPVNGKMIAMWKRALAALGAPDIKS